MCIHGYKQISLEIEFCFVPVLEIEPRAIHTWDNGYTTELHLQPEQGPGHVRQNTEIYSLAGLVQLKQETSLAFEIEKASFFLIIQV